MANKDQQEQRPVVVTSAEGGRSWIFFGYLESVGNRMNSVILVRARNCVYFSADTHGFFGLAAKGPSDQCRISPQIPSIEVFGVTNILDCTDAAAKRWEAEPWHD